MASKALDKSPVTVNVSCSAATAILTLFASIASEAVQVAACQLLMTIVFANGADAAALDLVSRLVAEKLSEDPPTSLVALMVSRVMQQNMPALRTAALHALALLLAIAVSAEAAGTA